MSIKINVRSIIFISFLFLFISTSQSAPSDMKVITDKTIDLIISKSKSNPWLIFFTVPKCALCNETLNAFANFTHYYSYEDNDLKPFNLSFGKLDCFQSSWSAMRFNIVTIPQVVLIGNGSYHLLKKNITEETLEDFIKVPGEGLAIPPAFTYTVIFSKFFELLSQFLESSFGKKGIIWHKSHTTVLVVFVVVLFCIFEYFFINYCCRKKKKPNVHLHTN